MHLLQIPTSVVDDGCCREPEGGRWQRSLRIVRHQRIQRGMDILTHEIHDGVDVDASRHVSHEVNQNCHAPEGQGNAKGEGQVRRERPFVVGTDAAQHHQRVRERPQEGPERELHAAIAREIAQQPGPHLTSRQRQRSNHDGEHGSGYTDGRCGDRAQQRPGACAAAVVDPIRVEPGRQFLGTIDLQ